MVGLVLGVGRVSFHSWLFLRQVFLHPPFAATRWADSFTVAYVALTEASVSLNRASALTGWAPSHPCLAKLTAFSVVVVTHKSHPTTGTHARLGRFGILG